MEMSSEKSRKIDISGREKNHSVRNFVTGRHPEYRKKFKKNIEIPLVGIDSPGKSMLQSHRLPWRILKGHTLHFHTGSESGSSLANPKGLSFHGLMERERRDDCVKSCIRPSELSEETYFYGDVIDFRHFGSWDTIIRKGRQISVLRTGYCEES